MTCSARVVPRCPVPQSYLDQKSGNRQEHGHPHGFPGNTSLTLERFAEWKAGTADDSRCTRRAHPRKMRYLRCGVGFAA